MRVGFYFGEIQSEKIGGGNVFQIAVLDALTKYKTKQELIIYYLCEQELFENTDKIKFVNLKYKAPNKIFSKKKYLTINLNSQIQKDNIELVYFLSPFSFESIDAPFIFTVWDLAFRVSPYFPEVSFLGIFEARENMYRNIIPKAAYTVIGNDEGRKQLVNYMNANEDNVKTIPMPTPDYVYKTQADTRVLKENNLKPKKYLFYPAQFWPHKNHIRLIKAMKKLRERGSGLKIVFTGSDRGNERYIKEQVKDFGLENDVLFLGFVKKDELIALYQNAFALTYASLFGPDNIPPLEAMALKCPVICSGINGMREQLKDCALFFDPKDENDLIRQLDLLKKDELRNLLICKGEKLAKSCSMDNYVSKMFEIIDEFEPIRECWSSKDLYVHL